MKKLTTYLLALLLVFSGGAFALAAEAADEAPLPAPVASPIRVDSGTLPNITVSQPAEEPMPAKEGGTLSGELARVTQIVKTKLNIDNSFTDFYGSQAEGGQGITWYLNWNNAEESISVEADNDGVVYSYNRYSYEDRYYYNSDFAPVFPKTEREEAQKAAEQFLKNVLGKNETFQLQEEKNMPLTPRVEGDFYFYGNITISGVPSPLYASITVNADHMRVSNFWREMASRSYVGGIPSPTPKISAAAAANTLAAQQKLTLAYYLTDGGQNEARLQYRPVNDNTYYVDAESGALIDLNKLYEEAQKSVLERGLSGGAGAASYDMEASSAAPAEAKLSDAEQAGIEKMDGLLPREELDAKLRAISELGLDNSYILSNVNYRQDYQYKSYGEPFPTSGYSAYLNYYREAKPIELGLSDAAYQKLKGDGLGLYIYKYAQMNAASGEFISISTSRPYVEAALITEKERDFAANAAAFAQKYFPEYYAESKLQENPYAKGQGYANYNYARQANGYSFTGNFLDVSVNPYTGVIENFYMSWDEDVTFAPATGIISEAKAKELYLNTLECRLLYSGLPEAVDPAQSGVQPLMDYYGGILYRMALVYAYEAADGGGIYAIDALSGEAIGYGQYEQPQLTYDDIENTSAKAQIEELARYGVGYAGGKFKPTAQLTEMDMLVFLLSADGYTYLTDDPSAGEIDNIYRAAISRGIIKRGEQQPKRQVSRGEFVKIIIAMSGYGKTANIPGIYVCSFADEAKIPAELYGYVAIAQGMGLIEGGKTAEFKASETISRAEAAVILYNFMAREY